MASLFPLVKLLQRLLPPETAHRLTVKALRRLPAREPPPDDPILATRVLGLDFPNPVGLAAGFDKDAETMAAVRGFGFGFAEVGTITPRPQPGNSKPRVFRLNEDRAVINRYGFNSAGLDAAEARLAAFRKGPGGPGFIVGINIGKNRDSRDAGADYAEGVERLWRYADYLVVNVSSPNTPGLRALQGREALTGLLKQVHAGLPPENAPPLLLKIAPDLTAADKADIAAVALDGEIDGLIVTNTTVARPYHLKSPYRRQSGGLSGEPLRRLSSAVLRDMYRLTEGRVPLIGVGGVASGLDAYRKIRAGASLVQLYTALIFQGPGLVARIKDELAYLLRRDGFAHVSEAVGADHAPPPDWVAPRETPSHLEAHT